MTAYRNDNGAFTNEISTPLMTSTSTGVKHNDMTIATSPTITGKRKKKDEPKFYSVRVGHRPGVYHTWSECLNQVTGFKGAIFKSFPSLTEAEKFLAGEDPSTGHGSGVFKFYAVRSGRKPGIYTDWQSAQKQVVGWSKPRYKCFPTRAEAQEFLKAREDGRSDDGTSSPADAEEGGNGESAQKKAKKSTATSSAAAEKARPVIPRAGDSLEYEPGSGLPLGSVDGFDRNIILEPHRGNVIFKTEGQREATKLKATVPAADSALRIYTDGSSLGNGKKSAFAGVGVYFGPYDDRNISEPLAGGRQTNQRAELTAILRALETAPRDRDVVIVTDSSYSIKCVTEWSERWKANGWRSAIGKTVENRDLIEGVLERLNERRAVSASTEFEWIKGHASSVGNNEADKLAVSGARKAAASAA